MKTLLFEKPASVLRHLLGILLLVQGWVTPHVVLAKENSSVQGLEHSIVTLEITRQTYDYQQPWTRRTDQVTKMGVVLNDNEVLTTADYLQDQTLIRLQKGGRGRWVEGNLKWIDYHANLAVIGSSDAKFWDGLKPMTIAKQTPTRGPAQMIRWRNGVLEARDLNINRLSVKRGKLTFIDVLQLELDTEIAGIGWSEAIIRGRQLIGITSSKEEHTCAALPASFLRMCLAARQEQKPFRGLGYFAFVWQRGDNPATLDFLKLRGDPRGVLVLEVSKNTRPEGSLQLRDLILSIEGFAIDAQGDYEDPDYGVLSLENLATRHRWAGDQVRLKVLRAGKEVETTYQLPKADYRAETVPNAAYDQEPEYLVLGGLVFQPLSVPYLQSWGTDYMRKAPFRLSFTSQNKSTHDRPSLVVLSTILPDIHNLGYQEARWLILDSMNGQKINRLNDLIEAKKSAKNGLHELVFQQGDSLSKLVLDATQTDEATQRVLERYGIEKPFVLAPPSTPKTP
ncbi:MAG: hypothetical protein DVB32_04850 [Verrucomicrobia bacterium]|nr:MAG: hypothetical protein DVB32_04850 [Verrucomicrobiota bacterium]